VLLWQYNNATNLQAIIENRKTWIDKNFKQFYNTPTSDSPSWVGFDDNGINFDDSIFYTDTNPDIIKYLADKYDNFYTHIFDLSTANDFGLSIWAVILGVYFDSLVSIPAKWFGFTSSNGVNFNQGVFYPKSGLILTTEEKRTILQLRYLYLTSNATLDKIIEAIQVVIPTLNIIDSLKMYIVLTSEVTVSLRLLNLIDSFNIIPRPAGVKILKRLGYGKWFDFTGSGGANLNNGNFGG